MDMQEAFRKAGILTTDKPSKIEKEAQSIKIKIQIKHKENT